MLHNGWLRSSASLLHVGDRKEKGLNPDRKVMIAKFRRASTRKETNRKMLRDGSRDIKTARYADLSPPQLASCSALEPFGGGACL